MFDTHMIFLNIDVCIIKQTSVASVSVYPELWLTI